MTAGPKDPAEETFSEFARRLTDLAEAARSEAARTEATREPVAPDTARLWAALAPGWTVPLARQAGFANLAPDTIAGAFQRLVDDGQMDAYPPDEAPAEGHGDTYYIMTSKARSEVLQARLPSLPSRSASTEPRTRAPQSIVLRALNSAASLLLPEQLSSAESLLKLVARIAVQVRRGSTDLDLPVELDRWAHLAVEAEDPSRVAQTFDATLKPLIETGDLASIRDWIEVARPLAVLFEYSGSNQLSVAIGQAGRRVELAKRQAIDFRHLAAFHRREEQIEAVRALLEGPDDQWALHLIGPGGVGKTMMVRYVSCLMAQAANSPCSKDPRPYANDSAVARIDFDYLNLDYPQINPGLLLVQLADELRAAGRERTNLLFDRAEAEFKLLNDAQKAEGFRRARRATLDPLMRSGIERYIEALRSVGKRVVLILDTCEELAKVDEGRAENTILDETFRILRALHDGPDALVDDSSGPGSGVESLRVIFSGRRPLASAGTDWSVAGSKLPSRPYLRIHRIRGFPKEDAGTYLERQDVPADLIPAVLAASSPDIGMGIDLRIKGGDPGPAAKDRCNPYLLRLYMDWALAEPRPTADSIQSGGLGRYIELRLLQRLGHRGLEPVLPLIALLGHVDRPMLAAIAQSGTAATDDLFVALANQEWIGTHRSEGAAPREILDVSPDFRNMLQAYFADRPITTGQVETILQVVEALTLDATPETIDWSDFDAGLRVMALDPGRGAAWWTKVESLLFDTRRHWIGELLGHLLSTEGAARPAEPSDPVGLSENPLRPFVLATRARIRALDGDAAGAADDWRLVAAELRDRRGTPAIDRLFRRALAGRIAAARSSGAIPPADLVRSFWRDWRAQTVTFAVPTDAASMLAAVEALVDIAELNPTRAPALLALPRGRNARLGSGPRWLVSQAQAAMATWLVDHPNRRAALNALEAAARVAAGRGCLLLGEDDDTASGFRKALELAPDGPVEGTWADWRPAANPRLRARLEVARAACPALLSPRAALELVQADDSDIDTSTADGDRFASTVIRLLLADGLGDVRDVAERWQDPSTGEAVVSTAEPADSQPINAHRLVPPLFASVADVLAADGNFAAAKRLLRGVVAAPDPPIGPSLDTRRHAERGLLRLARRLRSREGADPLDTTLSSSSDPADVALTGELLGLAGPTIVTERTRAATADANTAWRSAYIVDRDTAERVLASGVPALRAALEGSRDPLEQAGLFLDLQEAWTIAQIHGIGLTDLGVRPPQIASSDRPRTAPPGWDEKMLRLVLREAGLTGLGFSSDVHRHLIGQVGPCRAAEIAFEEGELLGLRLPTPAALILDAAADLYGEANDAFDRFRSLTLSAMFLARSLPFDRWPGGDELGATNIVEWLRREPRIVTNGRSRTSPSVDFLGQTRAAMESWEGTMTSLLNRTFTPAPVRLEEIGDVVEHPTPEGLGRLDDPELGPWIVRLAACLAVARDLFGGSAEGSSKDVIQDWVRQQYGAVTTQGVALPTEWTHFAKRTEGEPLPEPERAVIAEGTGAAGAVRESLSRGVAGAVFGRLFIVLIGVAIGVLGVAFLLWRMAVGAVFPSLVANSSLPELIVAFVVSVPAAVVFLYVARKVTGRAIRWASGFSLPFARLDLVIERADEPVVGVGAPPSPGLGKASARISLTSWRARPRLALPPYLLEPVVAAKPEYMVVDDTGTYALQALMLSSGLMSQLRPPAGLPGGHLHVRVMPQGELQALPWEAIFTLALTPGASSPKRSRVRVSRQPDASRVVFEEPRNRLRVLSVAATEVGSALVSRTIERIRGPMEWSVVSGISDVVLHGEAAIESAAFHESLAAPDIVHVIGIVTSDHGGPAMRLAPERTYGSQLASKSARTVEPATSQVLRPAELRNRYPDARLFILQGHPPEDTTERLASDRQAANLARLFAADLARKGTRVVVIPPVGGSVGSDVLRRLYQAAPDFIAKGAGAIMPRINRIQMDIFEGGQAARAWMWELALDVCVYDLPDRPIGSVQG
jgi:hypothetical protein